MEGALSHKQRSLDADIYELVQLFTAIQRIHKREPSLDDFQRHMVKMPPVNAPALFLKDVALRCGEVVVRAIRTWGTFSMFIPSLPRLESYSKLRFVDNVLSVTAFPVAQVLIVIGTANHPVELQFMLVPVLRSESSPSPRNLSNRFPPLPLC